MPTTTFQFLFYITHIENLPSILRHGILSHERVENEAVEFTPIYDADIVSNRKLRMVPGGDSLWHYANTYFQPRNAMLFRVAKEKGVSNLCVLAVQPSIVNRGDVVLTTGNAASPVSEFIQGSTKSKAIPGIVKKVAKKWWNEIDGSKREMMAECLVPGSIEPDNIRAVYVGDDSALERAKTLVRGALTVTRNPDMFFEPSRLVRISPTLSLADGDLFFAGKQTLTISVNVVGVMGKGLASTAKHRFPDVYVRYQDLCRTRALRMGKPVVVKRESSSEEQLADEPASVSNGNGGTWFLLFPTKRHWREPGDFNGIEQGLAWLAANARKEGIKSLAIPALGCGLGNLKWHDVGPLMCRYLAPMGIPTWIYLPSDHVPPEELTPEFLLRGNQGDQLLLETPN